LEFAGAGILENCLEA